MEIEQKLSVEHGNKIIAEFMGEKIAQVNIKGKVSFHLSNKFLAELSYHSSWDWLMPVVEKIESMGYTFKICRRRIEIDVDGEFNIYPKVNSKQETKIQSVMDGVIKFIELYNNQNKEHER